MDRLKFLFGSALPLLLGIIGIGAVLLDVFGTVELPSGWAQELLVAAASAVLLAYFTAHSASINAARQSKATEEKVERLCSIVEAERGGLRQVPASEIRSILSENLTGVSAFYFRGGSGRWLRNKTLPTLATISDREISLLVQLVDPRDENLCNAYADYRKRARRGPTKRADEGDPRLIQRDILAAVYLAAYYSHNARLRAEVVLMRSFSPLRYDVSNKGLVISVPDESRPGLVAAAGSWFHDSVVDEMKQAEHGNSRLIFGDRRDVYPSDLAAVDKDQVRAALAAITVKAPKVNEAASPFLEGFSDEAGIDWMRLVNEHIRPDARS